MTQSDSRIAVYTGSFDPITLGHLSVIQRSSRLVDRLIVGVGINADKLPLFSPEERVELVKQAVKTLANVEVTAFDGLAVAFVRACGARVIVAMPYLNGSRVERSMRWTSPWRMRSGMSLW